MRFREALHKKLAKYCDSVGSGDGLDPRYDTDENKKVMNRKALQLCSQVFETLSMVMPGMADEVLHSLNVKVVTLAPDTSQLLVTVCSDESEETVIRHLLAAKGKLRQEIATAIHRKKTPNLTFKVERNG